MAEPSRPPGTIAIAWGFVAAQVLLLGMIMVGPRDDGFGIGAPAEAVALGVMAAGGALGLWSAVHLGTGLTPSPLPNGSAHLVVAGPYRWVRHPMYVAVMMFMAGVAARSGSWLVVAALVALVVLFNVKARWEETHLEGTFPGYRRYARQTPRFLPHSASNRDSDAVPSTARR